MKKKNLRNKIENKIIKWAEYMNSDNLISLMRAECRWSKASVEHLHPINWKHFSKSTFLRGNTDDSCVVEK